MKESKIERRVLEIGGVTSTKVCSKVKEKCTLTDYFVEKTVSTSMSISTTTREKKTESADGGTSVKETW